MQSYFAVTHMHSQVSTLATIHTLMTCCHHVIVLQEKVTTICKQKLSTVKPWSHAYVKL